MSGASRAERVAVVTGAPGIGAATASALLRMASASTPLLAVRTTVADAAEIGCVTHDLDVTESAAVMALAEEVGNVDAGQQRWSRPDGRHPLELDDISRTIDTRPDGRHDGLLPAMIHRGSGHVVNLGSMAGSPSRRRPTGRPRQRSTASAPTFVLSYAAPASGSPRSVPDESPPSSDVAVTDPQRRSIQDSGIKRSQRMNLPTRFFMPSMCQPTSISTASNFSRLNRPTAACRSTLRSQQRTTSHDHPSNGRRPTRYGSPHGPYHGRSFWDGARQRGAAQGATLIPPILITPGLNTSLSSANRSVQACLRGRWRRQSADFCGETVNTAVESHGSIDVLVTAAGTIHRADSLEPAMLTGSG